MNKEKLINFLKKNKVYIIIGSLFLIGGYCLTHTNFSYHLEDRTGKYILNPEYKEFHKYEFTDLKSVYPTKLAYDTAWFKLPPDKYIPKEQPIPKNISNISDPTVRRQAYFNFLCKSEAIIYKEDINYKNNGGILDLTETILIPKINIKNNISQSELNSNPFILPFYSKSFNKIQKNDVYNFYYENITDNPHSNWNASQNSFIELMSSDGIIYQIKYDKENFKFLPIIINKNSEAVYYSIEKYIERDNMKNLGIYGVEGIVFDKINNKLVNYYKLFYIGSFLPWQEKNAVSNFSWSKINSCGTKPNIIKDFDKT